VTDRLTSATLKALRSADMVGFYSTDGKARITAIREAEHSSTGFEERVDIEVGGGGSPKINGYELLVSAQSRETWRTVVDLLRAGDELHLHWGADANTNELMRQRGLHGDRLQLWVWRDRKSGDRQRFVFEISSRVTLDNSARMIQTDLTLGRNIYQ
jgi:hypothetical protein